MQTGGGSFAGSDGSAFFRQPGIEGTALCKGNREYGTVSVDDVRHEQHGDMVRVFFDVLLLNFMDPFRTGDGQAASGNTEIIRGDS